MKTAKIQKITKCNLKNGSAYIKIATILKITCYKITSLCSKEELFSSMTTSSSFTPLFHFIVNCYMLSLNLHEKKKETFIIIFRIVVCYRFILPYINLFLIPFIHITVLVYTTVLWICTSHVTLTLSYLAIICPI